MLIATIIIWVAIIMAIRPVLFYAAVFIAFWITILVGPIVALLALAWYSKEVAAAVGVVVVFFLASYETTRAGRLIMPFRG
jgi:hypothetical protein